MIGLSFLLIICSTSLVLVKGAPFTLANKYTKLASLYFLIFDEQNPDQVIYENDCRLFVEEMSSLITEMESDCIEIQSDFINCTVILSDLHRATSQFLCLENENNLREDWEDKYAELFRQEPDLISSDFYIDCLDLNAAATGTFIDPFFSAYTVTKYLSLVDESVETEWNLNISLKFSAADCHNITALSNRFWQIKKLKFGKVMISSYETDASDGSSNTLKVENLWQMPRATLGCYESCTSTFLENLIGAISNDAGIFLVKETNFYFKIHTGSLPSFLVIVISPFLSTKISKENRTSSARISSCKTQ